MDYRSILERSFLESVNGSPIIPGARLRFLSKHVFEYFLEDPFMETLFAQKTIEICRLINDGTGLTEYVEDHDNYRWVLSLFNTPFFMFKIHWTTDIVMAEWDKKSDTIDLGNDHILDEDGKPIEGGIHFATCDWQEFVDEMLDFVSPDMPKQ